MKILTCRNEILSVYFILKLNTKHIVYYTEKKYIWSDDIVEIYSDMINNYYYKNSEYGEIYTDVKEITFEIAFSNYTQDDFANVEYKNTTSLITTELKKIYQKIEIDYIQWKVKNGKFEEWQNNFEDRIIELSDTERFIDDDNYGIFYNINDLDNIEVVKKLS